MSDNGHTGAFLAGFLIGGLFGAAAALLMTPQSGERTRLQLQERGIELKTQLDDLATDPKGRAGQFVSDARGRVGKLGAEIQERGRVIIEERRQSGDGADVASEDQEEEAA